MPYTDKDKLEKYIITNDIWILIRTVRAMQCIIEYMGNDNIS